MKKTYLIGFIFIIIINICLMNGKIYAAGPGGGANGGGFGGGSVVSGSSGSGSGSSSTSISGSGSSSTQNLTNIFDIGKEWTDTGKEHTDITMDTNQLKKISDQLYNILMAIATVVAVIAGAILGVQYMTVGINEKVKVKESLFPYLISCVVVFGSLGIWKLVVVIMSNF